MSDRIRIFIVILLTAAGLTGCSSGSPYVERSGWHLFSAHRPARSGEGGEGILRGQTDSGLHYTGSYSGSYSGGTASENRDQTLVIQSSAETASAEGQPGQPAEEPVQSAAGTETAVTGTVAAETAAAPSMLNPVPDAPQNSITAPAPLPDTFPNPAYATGIVEPSLVSPSQGTTVNASVPTENGSLGFSATIPDSQLPAPVPVFPDTSFYAPGTGTYPASNSSASSSSGINASSTAGSAGLTGSAGSAGSAGAAGSLSAANPLTANGLDETESEIPKTAAFPEFAKNAYGDLEEGVESSKNLPINPATGRPIPQRTRESVSDRQREEEALEATYRSWTAQQKMTEQENAKLPRYLQPLSDDRSVFDDPNGPFARKMQEDSQKEHKFIRQITAADLNMMSQVSSNDELMEWEKEQDGTTDWSKYSASSLYNKWRDFLGMGPNEKEALALMKQGCEKQVEYEQTKNKKKLKEAAVLYEKASKKWPDSLLEEDALFYAAECRFFNHEYTKALTLYKALVTKFSNSVLKRDATERLYWLGCYWLQCNEEDPVFINWGGGDRPVFSDFAGAKKAFETIFMNDVSDRGRAPDALFALANGYMRRGVEQGDASFDSAARYYQQLYEFYPACKHVDKAYQLAMLALYMSYRGPLYDSTPLKKAAEIAEAAQKAGRGEPDVIADQLSLIRKEQARYLLTRGEYYERQEYFASARSYYNQLVNEYPESEFAQEAAQRYETIRDNPAEADQFSLVRPVLPFLPKSKNKYYEERPSNTLDVLARSGQRRAGTIADPDFTALGEKKPDAKNKNGSSAPQAY